MQEVLRIPPTWLKNSLQGLAFWVGHRCSIYSDWELSEGALVGELCNLIHAHLGDKNSLRCEEPFSKFVHKGYSHKDIGKRARIDLSVWEKYVDANGAKKIRPSVALEVKRASAPFGKIKEDLVRLAAVAESGKKIRAFLCVVSERKLPTRFVVANTGFGKKGVTPIEGTQSSYQVICVVRASAFIKLIHKNHYCCAIEVIPNEIYEEEERDRLAAENGDEAS